MYAVRHKESEMADDLTQHFVNKGNVPISQEMLLEAIEHGRCTLETVEWYVN